MILTNDQMQGLKIGVKRFKDKEKYTVIAGFAGTGKSTLIKFIVSELNLKKSEVVYAAYTGKATQVLKRKGNENSMTLHRLLYNTFMSEEGKYTHIPKDHLPQGYKLIVIDEISMVPEDMWNLLLKHKIHIIACGDPFQLPAIGKSNNILENPHIFLQEIMRQEKESEIVRLSMAVRKGENIKKIRGKEVNITSCSALNEGMLKWADQIICGKNNTRFFLNDYIRKIIWGEKYSPEPIVGDKIICLRNNWDLLSDKMQEPLVNGTTGFIQEIENEKDKMLKQRCKINFKIDFNDDAFNEVLVDWNLFITHINIFEDPEYKNIPFIIKKLLNQIDFGYAITAWKAQGDEYNKVTFFGERVGNMEKEMYLRFLYTGITRAKEKLTLLLPYLD